MPLQIRTTGIEDYLGGDANIKALILGKPGAGKTLSASYWPKPIFADCEGGRASIARRRIPYADIKTSDDMLAFLRLIKAENGKPKADRRWLTVVIDTLDAFQRKLMQERLTAEKKDSFSGWADWGWLEAKMLQFLERLMNLDANVVVNLHIKEEKEGDDDNSLLITAPHLKGDIRTQIAAEFDLVGVMGSFWEAESGERVLKRGIRWEADPKHPIVKDRFGLLPKWTEVDFTEADYGRIFTALMTGMEELDGVASELVETVQTDADRRPPPVKANLRGGPVQAKAAAKPRRAVRPEPTTPSTPATPLAPPAGGASLAPTPQPAATTTATTTTDVTSDETAAAEPTQPVGDQPADEAPATPEQALQTIAAAGLRPQVLSVNRTTEDTGTTPTTNGTSPTQRHCGDPARAGAKAQREGCGKPVDPDHELTKIASVRWRTLLCPDCYATSKPAGRKPAQTADQN